MLGVEALPPEFGEKIFGCARLFPSSGGVDLDVKPSFTQKRSEGILKSVGSALLHYSPLKVFEGTTDKEFMSRPTTYCVDRVWPADECQTTTAELINRLLPLAFEVVGGASASVLHYRSAELPSASFFYDPRAGGQCSALTILEKLVESASRAGKPTYLSMGVVSMANGQEHIFDIIGSEKSAVKPTEVAVRPSLLHESIFADMTEIKVSYGRRCSDVFNEGMRTIMEFQKRYALPKKQSTLFVSIAVPLGNDLETVSTFTLIDTCDYRFFQSAALTEADLHDPYLGSRAATLLTYGLRLGNRVAAVVSVLDRPSIEDMQCLGALTSFREIATVPLNAAEEILELARIRVSRPFDDPDECRLYMDCSELMRHRALVNRISSASHKQSVLFSQLQQDFDNLRDQLKRTQEKIGDVLPEVLHELQSDALSTKILAARFEAVQELERAQEKERKRLEQWQNSLASLPVRREAGLTLIDANSRTQLLEGTIRELQNENERQRSLFSKDLSLIKLELDAVRLAHTSRGGREGRGEVVMGSLRFDRETHSTSNPLQPIIDGFSDECGLLLRSINPSSTLMQIHQLIDKLSSDLKLNADLLLFSSSEQGSRQGEGRRSPTTGHFLRIPRISSETSDESLFVRAALDRARRTLKISVAPPSDGSHFEPPSLAYWKSLIIERAACRSERWSYQHLSKGLALTATRLFEGLIGLGTILEKLSQFASEILTSHSQDGVDRHQGASKEQRLINELLRSEMVSQGRRPTRLGSPTAEQGLLSAQDELSALWASLSLQIGRCRDLAHLLQGASAVDMYFAATAASPRVPVPHYDYGLTFEENARGGGACIGDGALPLGFELIASPNRNEEVVGPAKEAEGGARSVIKQPDVPTVVNTSLEQIARELRGAQPSAHISNGSFQSKRDDERKKSPRIVTRGFFSQMTRK